MTEDSQLEDPTQSDSNRDSNSQTSSPANATGVAANRPKASAVEFPLTANDLGASQVSIQAQEPPPPPKREMKKPFVIGCGVLFYLGVGLALASTNLQARSFILSNKKWIFGTIVAVVLIAAFVAGRLKLKEATAQRRIGWIIFGVTPLVMVSVTTVILLPVVFRAAALRMIFLLCVCLLPAMMYYLFIATKKNSILNEFIINLDRLGLLEASGHVETANAVHKETEDEDERRNRVLTYLQRFEAAYGAFPTDLSQFVLNPTKLNQVVYEKSRSEGSTFASIFTAETTVPVMLTTILIALGWLITLPPWQGNVPTRELAGPALNWLRIFTPEQTPVHFAFIGTYFFSLQMLFRRYVRRDLRSSAYVAVSLRIILAVIGTWVVVASMSALFDRFGVEQLSVQPANQLLVLGFIIGVFPRVVWQIVGAVARKIGGSIFRLPSLQTELPITDLDGLTVWHESRLEEEDIENIPNMATADVVELLLTTRIPPDRLVDWVDQAILYTHLGPEKQKNVSRREALRTQGIRTASALIEGYTRSRDRGDLPVFEKILSDSASQRSPIRSLIDTMQTNPNLRLVQNWRGLEAFKPEPHAKQAAVSAQVPAASHP